MERDFEDELDPADYIRHYRKGEFGEFERKRRQVMLREMKKYPLNGFDVVVMIGVMLVALIGVAAMFGFTIQG